MSQLSEDTPGLDAMGLATALPDRPYHAKRPHKKSRAGCQNCKTRKVKCNEERPRCRACTLRREVCIYPAAAQTPAASGSTPPRTARPPAVARAAIAASASSSSTALVPASSYSSSSSSDDGSVSHARDYSRGGSPAMASTADEFTLVGWSTESTTSRQMSGHVRGGASIVDSGFTLLDEPLFVPAAIDQLDMKLLWFYTARGFDAFAAEAGHQPKVDEVLQVAIPRHAFGSRFLMDCLLALSALELQLLNQPIEPSRVLMYRARTFAGYRKAVEEATPETYPALLACSLLLCALSSEMFRDADRTPLYILDWMVVWRGIGLIVRLMQPDMLFKSGMYMLFTRPPINLDSSSKHIPNQMLFMVSSIRQDDPDFLYIDLYYETLKYLGSLYRQLESGIGRILSLRTITWLTFLPKGFVDIARERRPRALVILAHYLVFVKLCNSPWWMQGIADKEIKDILNVLEDEWKAYVAGPIAALETTDNVEIGKILLNNHSWKPDFVYDPVKGNQIKGLTLVDNSGHNIVYNGSWVQADTGKSAVWNIQDALDTSLTGFKPDELLGLRCLTLQNTEGDFAAAETSVDDDAFNSNSNG